MQKFQTISTHYEKELKQRHVKDLLTDSIRSRNLLFETQDFILDLTREKIDYFVMEEFQKIADQYIKPKIDQMYHGECINVTEGREVLHYALRCKEMPEKASENAKNLQKEAQECLSRVKDFSQRVRNGEYLNPEGKKFQNVVSVGIGGSSLGSTFLYESLRFNPRYKSEQNLHVEFLSNVDPISFHEISNKLDPKVTIILIVSKSFTTAETIQNSNLVKKWILDSYKDSDISQDKIIDSQFIAVSANIELCNQFGINEKNIYPMWDQIGGRFSISSAVGALPISLAFSYEVFDQFLNGMNVMDDQFFKTNSIQTNIPVLLSLIDSYHNYTQKFNTKVIIPYSEALHKFPAHIQQVEMESIGKGYNIETKQFLKSDEYVGQFVFGEPGTNSQHSFFQSLHQGRVSPIEFIGYCKPQNDHMEVNGVNCYNNFMANMLAQADAFALGEKQEDKAQHFDGDRPNFVLLFKDDANAYNLGLLMSIYENRCAASGFLADINTFDQYGVNLGKKLAKNIEPFLARSSQDKIQVPNIPSQYLISYFNKNIK